MTHAKVRRENMLADSRTRGGDAKGGKVMPVRSVGPIVSLCPSCIMGIAYALKYECVYLHAFETGSAARAGIGKWMTFYNTERPHSALGGRTPIEAHQGPDLKAAA